MPSSPSAQVARRMSKLAREVREAEKTAVNRASLEAKTVHLAELHKVVPSGRLRNVGRSGTRLGVRYDVKGATNPTALLRATGPWHLVENPIQAHTIKVRTRRRGGVRAKALATPYGPRMSVQHPGVNRTSGPWKRGAQKARPLVVKRVQGAFSDAWARGIRA